MSRGGLGHLQCCHRSLDDKNVAWGWWGALRWGHRRRGDRNRREPGPGEDGVLGWLLKMSGCVAAGHCGVAVVGLVTKMSRGAGEDHCGAGVDVGVAKIVRSDGCAHGVEGGPFSLWLREKSREVGDHHRGVTTGSVVTKMSTGAGAGTRACGGWASRWGIALRNQTESGDESPGTRPWRGLGAGGEAPLQRPATQNGSGTAPI